MNLMFLIYPSGFAICTLMTLFLYTSYEIDNLKKPHDIFSGIPCTTIIFDSPESGMNKMAEMGFGGIKKIEIVRSKPDFFSNCYYVEANIWADNRFDGTSTDGRDNIGWSYLKVKDGWVFIGGGEYKAFIISLGSWLFGLK